tara:strand:+ start:97 stop:1122 length:1026 start_codon:yes stop_codon:yes gene_type:complete
MNTSKKNTILVTGSSGFIGSAVCLKLIDSGEKVIGVDNHNDYYDPQLKENRLNRHINHKNYLHYRIDIEDSKKLNRIFVDHEIDYVIHLAAQAGVRYSLENPKKYINTNILGFLNILEECKKNHIKHLIYASSSSIYGLNQKIPFSPKHNTAHPISIYAATKKSNELMAHTYSHLFNLPTTGLRFFTVYGPWDRPDMALQLFANLIAKGQPIKLYNNGKHKRDFTYIDDIVQIISKIIYKPAMKNRKWDPLAPDPSSSSAPYKIYNVGNNKMEKLEKYISLLEKEMGIKAIKEMLPMQPGDVENTFADVDDLIKDFNYLPKTSIEEGISNFVEWYRHYYKM